VKTIHLGHHFFGAGNLGDDFMLAGFLRALAACGPVELTGCVPHPLPPLNSRFPEVRWLPYDRATRRGCIAACDIWLGLGGSPFQSEVSGWFADHLGEEAADCASARKPMYFLGVGGQDPQAYAVPALRRAAEQAVQIWTRDARTAEALRGFLPSPLVRDGADLAHLYFAACPPPPAAAGRVATALNFDYLGWPGLEAAAAALAELPARERIWLAQESRPLPGAEQWLFAQLPAAIQRAWQLRVVGHPGEPLPAALAAWPSAEWLLTSRFHATLAGAWAGSRAVVIASNEKLRGAAEECGYPSVAPGVSGAEISAALSTAPVPSPARLAARAAAAQGACAEFFAAAGLSLSGKG
jgi:hypothetical protein